MLPTAELLRAAALFFLHVDQALSLIGYHSDIHRNYSALDVNASAQTWDGPHEFVSLAYHAARAQAHQACRRYDPNVVRRNTETKESVLTFGGWCLPEGPNTSDLVDLPNGQTYMKPKVHASADMTNVAYIDRLLRGCDQGCDDPAGDADCNLPPRYSMLDFGAGVGQYGHSLLAIDPAHQYRGYDGAGNVETVTNNFIRWVDLSSANLSLPKADWVVSLAVGEHVPNTLEQSFVRNIHVHNCRGIVLCWGYLKEWGRGHVNNHGNAYIEKLFQELGYVFDAEASRQLRRRHARTNHESERKRLEHVIVKRGVGGPYAWFSRGMYVFRRTGPTNMRGCKTSN